MMALSIRGLFSALRLKTGTKLPQSGLSAAWRYAQLSSLTPATSFQIQPASSRFFATSSAAMSKPHILLLGKISHASAEWEALADVATLSVVESANRDEFIKDLKGKYSDITAIYRTFASVAITGFFDEPLFEAFPASLKFICHNGAGYDQIDIHSAIAHGVRVSNCPSTVDDATADVNMFLILGALRNFNQGLNSLRSGNWNKNVPLAHDPEGKVLGILGMGGIGRAVKTRAEAFGMTVQYYNRNKLSEELSGGAKYVSFDELLATSDVLSLNLPLNANTRHTINKEAFSKMKDGVFIVNTARGAVMDEAALVEALESGKVASAGLDVFESEPSIHPGLLSNDKVILLPHLGTLTYETQKKMEVQVIDNIRAALTTGKLNTLVPEQVAAKMQ
ncbi:D-isomer specific 2-hydroxyacid dehydrogenase [Limtongia smithiae]|uniref:D-isomer specific 2-hydroxyacid dehydrogenase n=1 Tax=Limtongia smithiae TaxID=1125753 RepID=UPI0034CE0BCC